MPRDPYEVLGVTRSASAADIKSAYRKLARENHPDRNPGDKQAEARFKEIQEAYDIVGDKDKRAQFDRFGFAGAAGAGGPFRPGDGPGGFEFQGGAVNPEDLESILRHFGGFPGMGGMGGGFGGQARGRSHRAAPPEAAEATVRVPFLTAAQGGTLPVRMDGRELSIKVPAGIGEGKKMRLSGQGPGGVDLILTLQIEPHPYFRREGNDLLIDVPVTITEAALGARVDVPTLDGAKLTVRVPPGTSSGARLRLRGKGVNGGDQYVEIKIVAPAVDDARGRELLEEFSRLHPQDPRAAAPWQ